MGTSYDCVGHLLLVFVTNASANKIIADTFNIWFYVIAYRKFVTFCSECTAGNHLPHLQKEVYDNRNEVTQERRNFGECYNATSEQDSSLPNAGFVEKSGNAFQCIYVLAPMITGRDMASYHFKLG